MYMYVYCLYVYVCVCVCVCGPHTRWLNTQVENLQDITSVKTQELFLWIEPSR